MIKVFRHKTVHLAQPKPICEFKKKTVTWKYHHHNAQAHLKLTTLPTPKTWKTPFGNKVSIDQVFSISISHLCQNLQEGVFGPSGYIAYLKANKADGTKTTTPQQDFQHALNDICDPNQ